MYKPNEGQLLVHQSKVKERFVFAANGTGKTCLLVQEIYWRCVDGHNPITEQNYKVPCDSIVVLDAPNKVKDVLKPQFEKWFNMKDWKWMKNGKPYENQIIFPNGSTLTVMFHNQDPMVFEGININGDLFFDEPPPRHIYIALSRGMREKYSDTRVLFIGTPIAEPWLRKDIWDQWKNGERG